MSNVEIGISGWNYKGWKGTFYPQGISPQEELTFASRQLPTIEINSTFYRLHDPLTFQKWYDATPPDFIFSVKANRYITHIRRLHNVEIPMANFFASGVLALKEKLGPILWQFPPSMVFKPERFESFLSLLPKNFKDAAKLAKKSIFPLDKTFSLYDENLMMRHAVEVRNMSFLNPWFIELLKRHNVAIVFADTAGKWPYLEDITADFIYVRLHGDSELYASGYDKNSLDFWSRRIKKWKEGEEPQDRLTISEDKASHEERDVYVYFDNDAKVRAPVDAKSLISRLNH